MSKESYVLTGKTMKFAEEIISVCQAMKSTAITRPILSQLIRSGTSIGANYAEANSASSKKDFRNKMYIVKKEAQETLYWLNLVSKTIEGEKLTDRINFLQDECLQILIIVQKALKTLDNNSNDSK